MRHLILLLATSIALLVGKTESAWGYPIVGQQVPFRSFVFPIMSPRKSSPFGTRVHPKLRYVRHHDGVDLAAPSSSPIRAVADGVVVFADPYAGYGNLIVVKHPNGVTTHYGHCQAIKVKPGNRVTAGQIIGLVGSTGLSTGPHLHFEVRKDGHAYDPEALLPGLAIEARG